MKSRLIFLLGTSLLISGCSLSGAYRKTDSTTETQVSHPKNPQKTVRTQLSKKSKNQKIEVKCAVSDH